MSTHENDLQGPEELTAEELAQQEALQTVLEQRREVVEDKQERRRDRYADLAAKNSQESSRRLQASHDEAEGIPLGQPILVGHHSEKRHRAHLKTIHGHMDKSIEHGRKADYYRGKLTSMDNNQAISSDDPDALEKLRDKLAQMEANQEYMKAANRLVRKVLKMGDLDDARKVAKLVELAEAKDLEVSEKIATGLLTKDFAGRYGFADYKLSNNNANMRRVRERIAELEQQHARITEQGEEESTEYPDLGLEVVQNNVLNRIQLIFNAKPPAEVRDIVKQNGFRWARSEGAWQRQLNAVGISAAQVVVNQLRNRQELAEEI